MVDLISLLTLPWWAGDLRPLLNRGEEVGSSEFFCGSYKNTRNRLWGRPIRSAELLGNIDESAS